MPDVCDAAPKVLDPKVGVLLVVFPAAPKLPNVGVFVEGLPNIDFAAPGAAGEPNDGVLATGVELLLLAPPKLNADVVDGSVGLGVVEPAAPPKLNPD